MSKTWEIHNDTYLLKKDVDAEFNIMLKWNRR